MTHGCASQRAGNRDVLETSVAPLEPPQPRPEAWSARGNSRRVSNSSFRLFTKTHFDFACEFSWASGVTGRRFRGPERRARSGWWSESRQNHFSETLINQRDTKSGQQDSNLRSVVGWLDVDNDQLSESRQNHFCRTMENQQVGLLERQDSNLGMRGRERR